MLVNPTIGFQCFQKSIIKDCLTHLPRSKVDLLCHQSMYISEDCSLHKAPFETDWTLEATTIKRKFRKVAIEKVDSFFKAKWIMRLSVLCNFSPFYLKFSYINIWTSYTSTPIIQINWCSCCTLCLWFSRLIVAYGYGYGSLFNLGRPLAKRLLY